MNTLTARRAGLAALALSATVALAGCGGSDSSSTTANDQPSMSDSMSDTMSDSPSTSGSDAMTQTFGPACGQVPKSGPGSFNGMQTAPVASAASANPLLKTLVTAVKKAGLVDTLNNADGITVFAPTNDAFGKIPPKTLQGVLANKPLLTKILTHHVIAGQLSPDQLAGTHKTLAGDTLKVTGSGESFKVGAEKASVLCGNVPTANATVYIVDTVLMPAS